MSGCNCCTGIGPSTPTVVFNRPGLSAIAYRSGTWHEFKESLLAALADSKHPELAGLATRIDDDFSIALLDAVAVVGDVLSFYGERIANESYLRTATERVSVLELVTFGAVGRLWLGGGEEEIQQAARAVDEVLASLTGRAPGKSQ